MNHWKSLLICLACLATMPVLAKNEAEKAAEKGLQAVTVFMDVNRLSRKNLAAKNMTKIHNEFAAVGYELVGVSPYTENSDLEGFFLSYKKQ